jgi:hypothetical protein
MTLAEFITSWVAIATFGFFTALFMYLLIFRYKEVLDFEAKHIWSRYDAVCDKAKRFIRNLLRKSDKIVAWAAKPTKHGKPDEDWITGQIRVFGDAWK